MTDESIRFRVCTYFTLEIYRFFCFFIRSLFSFLNNLFLFNETRSKFQLGIVNVNHNVVGLPTTSGFVLTLTRFVTRTFFFCSTSCTLSECLIKVERFVIFRNINKGEKKKRDFVCSLEHTHTHVF